MLQAWYAENTSGTLVIGKVNASFLSGFPNVGFTLRDIKHTNRDTITDQFSTLKIDEAKLIIGAGNLLRGDFIFRKIGIKNAEFSSEVISNRPIAYHQQLKQDKQKDHKGFQLPEWLNHNGATVTLENIKYISKDTVLNKHFDLHIHKFKASFKANGTQLNGDAAMDVTINHLGFNTTKGSFFKNAHVTGSPKFSVDVENDRIQIPDFPLSIDDQTFQLSANFNLSESNGYEFNLQNPTTDFQAVKRFLNDSIFSILKDFEIQKPLKSAIKISGKFAYGNSPDIEADYSTTDNEITISDKFRFKKVAFTGNLTTDIYKTDSLKTAKKSPKDIKVFFNSLNAELEDVNVAILNSYFQSTPEALNFIEANVRLKGTNETLAKLIETDNFDFKGGNFQLNTHIVGDIPNPYQVLNKATGDFKLNNTRVVLKKNGLQLPIQSISIALERETSILRELTVKLPNGEDLVFTGTLKSISGLLSKSPISPTTSHISLDSENLNISEVIEMAKEFVPDADANVNDRRTLHETLDAIYSQFHPQFDITIGALKYKDVVITDLKSKIELIDSETIRLRNFNFNYDDAVTTLKGNVKVYPPESGLKDAVYMNAEATSEGSLQVFKELFNIELFRIDSGRFKFNGNVNGNVKAFNELLNNAKGDLTLLDTKLYYPPAEMDIAIDSLALFVNNADIILNQFNLEIDEFHPVKLNGIIKKFPNFLLDDIKESGSVFIKVTAPFFDGDHLLTTINSFTRDSIIKQQKTKRALHNIFKDINKFNPEIELAIDSLKFRDLITEKIAAQIYFENDSILKLDHLNLNYKETIANIQGDINAHTSREDLLNDNPFDLDFSVQVKGKSKDLNDYLKTSNFVFKSGDFEFYGNYKGQSKNLKLLNSEASGDLKIGGTLVDFEAADLQIPVDSLHIEINNDLATLKTLDIQLPGKSSVVFSGAIDNFSEFINGAAENRQHSSNFSIHAPYLDTSDIKEFLDRSESTTKKIEATDLNLQKWKEVLTKINKSFYPSVAVQVDTLKHNNFNITDFESQLLFDNKGLFKIEDTQLDFYGGTIAMTVEIGIKKDKNTEVTIAMKANDVDLHEMVTHFDYFKNEDLKQAEHLGGTLNYNINATGSLDNEGQLNMNSLNGFLSLDLQNLMLYDYKPIMENTPLMKDERFKNLRFRPIVQTFEIRNGEILIPRTEIQSSAMHMYVEGRMKLNDYVNIWLALPYKNLKSNDGLALPEKTTYEDAGSKFFIQFVQYENSTKARQQKLKVKIRLGNRKLRKMRDSSN
ncbi:hypothetical protein A9996_07470 [Gelidibacter algens]|nr:hypothetical protein A9996_07470 [Gelidibacter algens]